MILFLLILSSFFSYTFFKGTLLFPGHPLPVFFGSAFLFCLMISPMMITRRWPDSFQKIWFMVLSWLGSFLMGWWGTYILISLPLDALELAYSLFHRGQTLIPTVGQWVGCVFSLFISFIGFLEVLRGPHIVKVDVPIKNLPDDLLNLTIAQISDLHIGPTIQKRYVGKVIEKTNALKADLIAITGDLTDAPPEKIQDPLMLLKNLKSRLGTFYVTGNHEYYWNIKTLLPKLQSLGLELLFNSNRIIQVNQSKILIGGITDKTGGHFLKEHYSNILKARKSSEETQLNILLSHRPDPYKKADELGFHLQLAGHTHAGQFFPFSLLIPLAHRHYRGLSRFGKLWIYVNPGTGYWGPAHRFAIAAEITLLRLTQA